MAITDLVLKFSAWIYQRLKHARPDEVQYLENKYGGDIVNWLGAPLVSFADSAGFQISELPPPKRWSGTYEDAFNQISNRVKEWLDGQAMLLLADLDRSSRRGFNAFRSRPSHNLLVVKGECDSSTRLLLDLVRRKMSERHDDVLYFDCAAVSPLEVHNLFQDNIGYWLHVPDTKESASNYPERKLDLSRLDAALKKGRRFLILNEPNHLWEDYEGVSTSIVENAVALFKRLIERSRRTNTTVLLGVLDTPTKASRELNNHLEELKPKLFYINEIEPKVYREILTPHIGQRHLPKLDSIRLDSLILLTGVLKRLSNPESIATLLKSLHNSKEEARLEILLNKAIELLVEQYKEKGGSIPSAQQDLWGLLGGLSVFPTPVPISGIRRLWYDSELYSEVLKGVTWELGEDWLLSELITLGLVGRKTPSDSLLGPRYALRPAFREDCGKYLSDSREQAQERVIEILQRLKPPGVTYFSKYLSSGSFRPLDDILGFVDWSSSGGEKLRIPLPPIVCDLISAVRRGDDSPKCRFRNYSWTDSAGERHSDLFISIAPAELRDWAKIYRVRAHLVNREGSGRAVQQALDPYVTQYIDSTGDAFRCGPGGYVELLVRLKEPDEIINSPGEGETVAKYLKSKHALPHYKIIEKRVAQVLHVGVDEAAKVTIIPCTPNRVKDELLAMQDLSPGSVRIQEVAPGMYGAANSYELIADQSALKAIREVYGASNEHGFLIKCLHSRIAEQVFLIIQPLRLEDDVRALISPVEEGRREPFPPATLPLFARADEGGINLLSIRHGPGGGYFANIELPSIFGENGQAENMKRMRAGLIDELKKKLIDDGVELGVIGGLHEVPTLEPEEKSGADDGRGGFLEPGKGPEHEEMVYDLVSDPALFHRYMRKHLFIPDSDAAAVALAKHFASRLTGTPSILEIGSGTGALSEKLVAAGLSNLDVVDPDQEMVRFWKQLKKERGLQQDGAVFIEKLENFESPRDEPYDLLVSQGVHHHIQTYLGHDQNYRMTFLKHCRSFLRQGGYYILSDEFVYDYGGDEERRIEHLDRWYRRVISSAFADGYPPLAYLEYGFWLNDRSATGERKESVEDFLNRLQSEGKKAPFEVESVTKFGLTEDFGGGFAVLVLRAK